MLYRFDEKRRSVRYEMEDKVHRDNEKIKACMGVFIRVNLYAVVLVS